MGCGGSKSVAVHPPSRGSSTVSRGFNTNTATLEEDEINIFGNTTNNENNNAKPRLRSAIRRDTDIKPVTAEVKATTSDFESDSYDIKPPPLDFTEQQFVFEPPLNRDSGFDSSRALWEDSARPKSSLREEASSVATTATTMRPDSVLTGSVLTARDLNTSFMTMSDYTTQPNGDVSLDLDTQFEDISDFDDSLYRTLSNTPSRTFSNTPSRTLSNTPSARPLSSTPSRLVFSTEPLSGPIHPKNIDVIKEESEGGFTPRSILDEVVTPRIKLETPRGAGLPKYYSDEVYSHNKKAAWGEWGIYKGMVCDASKVIDVFSEMHAAHGRKKHERRKEEMLMARAEACSDDSFDDDDDDDDDTYFEELQPFESLFPKKDINPRRSLRIAIDILLNVGLPIDVIEQHLPQCAIGEFRVGFSPEFWDSFRRDVDTVLDDLIREDLKDELSEYTKDILEQLQRWISKYRLQNPKPEQKSSGDPNVVAFSLPDGIRDRPDCLRRWVQSWEKFDMEIPESGSWFRYEVETIDLGKPQEIFEASLRSDADLCNPFITSVDGEAAWEVLLQGLVADDIMTDEQRAIDESRRKRTDLHDPKRMARRRVKLLNYFVKKYEMNESKANQFLQWSQAMEEGDVKLQRLCGISPIEGINFYLK